MNGIRERRESQKLGTDAEVAAGRGERYRKSSPRIRFGEVARGPAGPYWLSGPKVWLGTWVVVAAAVVPLQP